MTPLLKVLCNFAIHSVGAVVFSYLFQHKLEKIQSLKYTEVVWIFVSQHVFFWAGYSDYAKSN